MLLQSFTAAQACLTNPHSDRRRRSCLPPIQHLSAPSPAGPGCAGANAACGHRGSTLCRLCPSVFRHGQSTGSANVRSPGDCIMVAAQVTLCPASIPAAQRRSTAPSAADLPTDIRRDRSGRGSSPCPRRPRSPPRTAARRLRTRRPPRSPGAGSSIRR